MVSNLKPAVLLTASVAEYSNNSTRRNHDLGESPTVATVHALCTMFRLDGYHGNCTLPTFVLVGRQMRASVKRVVQDSTQHKK